VALVQRTVIKVAVGLAAIAVLVVLIIRSARDVGAQPYTIPREHLVAWTVAIDPAAAASGVLLALRPPSALGPPLFTQIFSRSGQSLSGPESVGMPLVLRSEFEQALSGTFTADALLTMARASGLESMAPRPLCMASRRVSQPGSTREVFFLRLEHPPFEQFRRQIAERVSASGRTTGSFDANNLSPVVIVAATDASFGSWLPLRGEATQDCRASIDVQ
jgi:hypothetical protein